MRKHILIVEDHPWLRDALRLLLEDEGYDVSSAANGVDALKEAARLPPDLVLTDINMPAMTGPELRRALRAAGQTMPVVFMSGSASLAAIAAAAAADAYVVKPFSIDDLLAVVDRQLRPAAA